MTKKQDQGRQKGQQQPLLFTYHTPNTYFWVEHSMRSASKNKTLIWHWTPPSNKCVRQPHLLPALVEGGEFCFQHPAAIQREQLAPLVPDRQKENHENIAIKFHSPKNRRFCDLCVFFSKGARGASDSRERSIWGQHRSRDSTANQTYLTTPKLTIVRATPIPPRPPQAAKNY